METPRIRPRFVEDEDESSSPWVVAELEIMLTPGTVIEVIALEAAEAELKPEASTFKSIATEPFRHLLVSKLRLQSESPLLT